MAVHDEQLFSVNLSVLDWMNIVDNVFCKYNTTTVIAGNEHFQSKDTLFWDINDSDRLFLQGVFAEFDRFSDDKLPSLLNLVSNKDTTLKSIVELWNKYCS